VPPSLAWSGLHQRGLEPVLAEGREVDREVNGVGEAVCEPSSCLKHVVEGKRGTGRTP
jgi:hypothetical protein